jgi:hypothetical protein
MDDRCSHFALRNGHDLPRLAISSKIASVIDDVVEGIGEVLAGLGTTPARQRAALRMASRPQNDTRTIGGALDNNPHMRVGKWQQMGPRRTRHRAAPSA